MNNPPPANQDLEHLRLLSIFHYVYGGLHVVFGFFPLVYAGFGLLMLYAPQMFGPNNPRMGQPPPEFLGWFLVAVGGVVAIMIWGIASLLIHSGRCLSQQRRHTFCLIVAAISCLFMPLGTILGVFTIVVLSRPSVKNLFEARHQRDDQFGFEEPDQV